MTQGLKLTKVEFEGRYSVNGNIIKIKVLKIE